MKQRILKIWNFSMLLAKGYFKSSLYLIAPQIVSIFVILITLPIILGNLEVKDYGLLQFVFAIQVWLAALTAENATIGAQRGIARGLEGTFFYALFSRMKLVVPLGLLVLAAVPVVSFFGYELLSQLLLILGAFFLVGYLPQISYPSLFIAKKQFKELAFFQVALYVFVPVMTVTAAVLTQDILVFALTHFGMHAFIGWTGLVYVAAKNDLLRSFREKKIDKDSFSYGVRMIFPSVTLQSANKVSEFIIGPLFGFQSLAVFSVAHNVEKKSRMPMKLLHNLLYSDFAADGWDSLITKIRSKLLEMVVLSIGVGLALAAVGSLYLGLFLPDSYQ
ncbi:MAG: oligosaccharide flippase family protein, partial [archaeon]|nr:oligosaccharide flippase family protein [archaeon]